MDPGTLPVLAEHCHESRFIVPTAEIEHAISIGLPENRLLGMDDGIEHELARGVSVRAIAAAHEELSTNDRGEHRFLGYLFRFENGLVAYHSGDCVPYEGLVERLRDQEITLALLPINGRDDIRRKQNIAGNFHFEEAVDLCNQIDIPILVGHHFGMFDFNTVDPQEIREKIRYLSSGPDCILPELGSWYEVSRVQ